MPGLEPLELVTFSSELGWMALVASARQVKQMVSARPSATAAQCAIDPELAQRATLGDDWLWLVQRLQQYAAGIPDDFSDVPLDLSGLTTFQRAVIRKCRAIEYGQTRSYGELATLAGTPGAARAVGSTMANCPFGLLVPCHRVINSNGSLGSFGGPEGTRLKRRLIELEQRGLEVFGKPKRRRAAGRQ